jgi:hypothetical protein
MARTARSTTEKQASTRSERSHAPGEGLENEIQVHRTYVTYYLSKNKPMKKKYYDKQYRVLHDRYHEGEEYARRLKEYYDDQDSAVEPEEAYQYEGRGGGRGSRKRGRKYHPGKSYGVFR